MKTIDAKQLEAFKADGDRSLYIIDLRTPDEYRAGHRHDSTYGWGVTADLAGDAYVCGQTFSLLTNIVTVGVA